MTDVAWELGLEMNENGTLVGWMDELGFTLNAQASNTALVEAHPVTYSGSL